MRLTRILLTPMFLSFIFACGGHDQSDGIPARLDALFDRLDEHLLFRGTALVSDGDRVAYVTTRGKANEEWDIPNTVDTRYRIASLSKQFTAVVVLQLVDEGRLSLDDTLAAHLSGLLEDWADKVTVKDLLNQKMNIQHL